MVVGIANQSALFLGSIAILLINLLMTLTPVDLKLKVKKFFQYDGLR